MSGILEEILENQKQIMAMIEGLGAPAGSAPAAEKTKPATKTKPVKPAKPAFSAEELRDKFLEVQKMHGDQATKALIKELGHDKLANLIADADGWQKSWDAAEAKLAEAADEDDNGGL